MSKKKWLLVIAGILLLGGYWKFFYKTWSETAVAKSADCIVALDIKRVTNTIIWNTITTPSQWRKISFSTSGKFSWKDMVRIPDYVFVFHSANQPPNAWYTLLDIKDSSDFEKGLLYYHFEKSEIQPRWEEYFSKELGIELIKVADKILIGNIDVSNKNYIRQVAAELFVQQKFIARKQLFKNIEASSHLSVQVAKNNFLQEDAIIMLNFEKKKIDIEAAFTPRQPFFFTTYNFTYSEDALCSTGFTQPTPSCYALLNTSTKEKISKAINFNIDSLLLQSNRSYGLDITSISARVDSAISYSYDDNFNQVQNVVVNNVLEPAFLFTIHGDSVSNIYDYWSRSGQLERSDTGDLFLPVPFVKSWCNKRSGTVLTVESAGFRNERRSNSINCIFFFKLIFTKIPAELLKYLPSGLASSIANLESMKITIRNSEGALKLEGQIIKKKNDLPVLKL
jgi:hypothetical protein